MLGVTNALATVVAEVESAGAGATLELNFDPSQMFAYTNVVI